MVNNTSQSSVDRNSFSTLPDGYHVALALVIAILSPVAVAGNSLVLAAIWRNPSLRSPSYLLLGVLALTDFCTGLITQPCFVVIYLAKGHLLKEWSSCFVDVFNASAIGFGIYLTSVTILTMTVMSIERWLQMTRQSITTSRFCKILVFVLLCPIPFGVFGSLSMLEVLNFNDLGKTSSVLMVFCLGTTSVAYFKVFRIVRRHQQQIHVNESSQNIGQPAINLAKYKKSVFSMLYILLLFYVSWLPIVFCFGASYFLDHKALGPAWGISVMFLHASPSLNPLLYYWRMKDIRDGVKQLLKNIICKETLST